MKLGLHSDSQPVRPPWDCLITEITENTKQPINCTNTSRGVSHVVLLEVRNQESILWLNSGSGKIKFLSWDRIFGAVQSQFNSL